ncbi:MAG: cyclic nucleotide-binding domain-containing protein [Gammaproteobacteria bacterium]
MSLTPTEKEYLRSLVPLDFLSDENFERLIEKSSKVETIPAGNTIFNKGDMDRTAVYLLSGEAEVSALTKSDEAEKITAGSDDGHHPLAPSQPRQTTAVAMSEVRLIRIDTNTLDIMLTWDQEAGGMEVMEMDEGDEDLVGDGSNAWMSKLLSNQAFYKIPPENIHTVLTKMESVRYNAGDVVINQGDEGDYFYVIKSGDCDVIRETPRDPEGIKLAVLHPGDSFGEDALISNNKRNATIVMNTDGELMRLAKDDFVNLLTAPVLESLSWPKANAAARKGAIFLDVRLPSEYNKSHIRGSVNLPLYFVRTKISAFKRDKIYMVYCDTGRRSSAAAFVLKQAGISVYLVEGGLHAMAAANKAPAEA